MFTTVAIKDFKSKVPYSPVSIYPFSNGQICWNTNIIWNSQYTLPSGGNINGNKNPGAWCLSISPGFVNEQDARVPVAEDPENKPKYNFAGTLISGEEVGLMDEPIIPVLGGYSDFFDTYPDGTSINHTIPKYFSQYNIVDPSSVIQGNPDSGNITINTDTGSDERKLYTSVVYIFNARPAYSTTVDFGDSILGTTPAVLYSTIYNNTPLQTFGRRACIATAAYMPHTPQIPDFATKGIGSSNDDGIDYLLLATIYFLTPAGDTTSNPDSLDKNKNPLCTAYIQHNVFWNLGYTYKHLIPNNLQPFGLDPATAFFVGQYVSPGFVEGGLTSVESQLMNQVLNNQDPSGFYFTQ